MYYVLEMLSPDIIKHIFTLVPGNDHIILSKVCHYWLTLLNEIPQAVNIHENSYQLYKQYKEDGADAIKYYKHTTSPYCLNLFVHIFINHEFDIGDDNIDHMMDMYNVLLYNIIEEEHTYCPKYDILFLKTYLDLNDGHYVEYDAEFSYKKRYHSVYGELLTKCIMWKHTYTKYLLLLKVTPCYFIRHIEWVLNRDKMCVDDVLRCFDFLFSLHIVSIPMIYMKVSKLNFTHCDVVCSHIQTYLDNTSITSNLLDLVYESQ